jgi:branched-subunit amino acid transport protein
MLWLLIVVVGLITYGIRLSLIALQDRIVLPPIVVRSLRYVPVAILTAIVVPDLVMPTGSLDVSFGNARLLAGVLAAAIAWRTRQIALTLVAGMATLWLLLALH